MTCLTRIIFIFKEGGTAAMSITLVVVFFFFVLGVWSFLKQKTRQGYGPRIYPVVGNLFEFISNRNRFLEWTTEYLEKAPGNTVTLKRFGEWEIKVTANPANVEHILKTKFQNYPKGDHISKNLADLLGDGIFIADDDDWKLQRTLASYEFTTRSLRDYLMESLAREVEARLLPTIYSVCEAGSCVDLQDLFTRFSFDNICHLAFGVDPMCLGPSFPAVKFAQAFDEATSLITQRFFQIHPLVWKTLKLLNICRERRLKEALAVVNDFAVKIIRDRREAIAKGTCLKQDLLSRFIDGNDFSDKFLRDIVISFVLGARDTTSAALAWFFWVLSNHPDVEHKIIQEVDHTVTSRTTNSAGNSSSFSYDELRDMHYLQAALWETLRLYPAVPVDTKVARSADVWPDGTRVEAGMRVTYHVYAMGRLEKLWGKDYLEFKPERWIKDGQFVPESPYKFPAFQAGPRICIGKEMAMLVMKYVAVSLLPQFRFEMVKPKEERPAYKINMTLPMRDGLLVVPKTRR